MKKIIAYSLISFFALTILTAAQPQNKPASRERGREFIKDLNLTPDQEKQMKDIRYQQQKKGIDLQSQIQKNRLELKHLVAKNNIDENKILELTDANSKIQAELKIAKVKSWLSIYKILNPEQKEMWAKHFESFGNNMRERMKGKMMKNMDDKNQMRMQRLNRNQPMGMNDFDEDNLATTPEPDDN